MKGFGGIGGILRWKVDFVQLQEYEEAADADHDDSDSNSDGGDDDEYGFEDGDFGF